jgi:hypothetical protein
MSGAQYGFQAYCVQVEWGFMDELVSRIVSNVGIERSVATKAVGIMFDFLASEGPADKAQALLARLPGAAEAIEAARADGGGGFFGGMGGIMGVGSRLMSAGLGMGEIQGVARQVIAYAREKAGDEDIDAVMDSIPGARTFL